MNTEFRIGFHRIWISGIGLGPALKKNSIMNREIKFRAWDKQNKIMAKVWEINYAGFEGNVIASLFAVNRVIDCEYVLRGESAVLMQYTGLKDKNGKEIYEGDIIQFKKEGRTRMWDHDWIASSNNILKATVKYSNGSFFIDGPAFIRLHQFPYYIDCGEHLSGKWEDKFSDFEIVGNIYEHPDLLK